MSKKNNNLLEKIWEVVQENTKKLTNIDKHVAVINSEMLDVRDEIKDIKGNFATKEETRGIETNIKKLQDTKVSLERFSPVEKIAYFIAGTIGGGIILTLGGKMLSSLLK